MIRRFVVQREVPSPNVSEALRAFAHAGHPDVTVDCQDVFLTEGSFNEGRLLRLFANPDAGEIVWEETSPPQDVDAVVDVAYRPSVIDPETLTGLETAQALGVNGLEWLRVARRYRVQGLDPETARQVIEAQPTLCNSTVQIVLEPGTYQDTLRPTGVPNPLKLIDLASKNDDELDMLSVGMGWHAPLAQMRVMKHRQGELGRPWRHPEVEITVQCWSDHCYHTKWKGLGLLQALAEAIKRINHPLVASALVDNAGGMFFYDGYVVVMKDESHNHPLNVFPDGGEQTKHGGGIRDIDGFGLGAHPIMTCTITSTMHPGMEDAQLPKGVLHPRTIVRGAISGTSSYCNPMGIRMGNVKYGCHPWYAKAFTLGGVVGIIPANAVKKEKPRKGDHLVLIGGATGRDGIHGATLSSTGTTAEMVVKEGASVQIGGPITEREFVNATAVLRDRRLVRNKTDLGAGGISCAVTEMAGECGADIDVTDLPVKDESLDATEKLLSESQERMLLDVEPDKLPDVMETCAEFGVRAFDLGTCRDDGMLVVTDRGEVVVELDLHWLWSACPIEPLETADPGIIRHLIGSEVIDGRLSEDLFFGVLGDYNFCDQSYAIRQFDTTVQGKTVVGPLHSGVPSNADVSAPFFNKPYGVVRASSLTPVWYATDPVRAVGANMALTISKTVASGVSPHELVLGGNYYNAMRTSEHRWVLQQMVNNCIRLMGVWGVVIVVGKDSSSGSYYPEDGEPIDVPPTFVCSSLGRMRDVNVIVHKTFRRAGDEIVLIRPKCQVSLAGSAAYQVAFGTEAEDAHLPWVDDERDLPLLWEAIHSNYGLFGSIAAVDEGGVFLQLFHGAQASGLGANIQLQGEDASWDLHGAAPGAFLVTTADAELLCETLSQFDCVRLGTVVDDPGLEITVDDSTILSRQSWPSLVKRWSTAFEEVLS